MENLESAASLANANVAAWTTLCNKAKGIQQQLDLCTKNTGRIQERVSTTRGEIKELEQQVHDYDKQIRREKEQELKAIEQVSKQAAKKARTQFYSYLTLGIYGMFESSHAGTDPEGQRIKARRYYENQVRLSEKEAEKIAEMQAAALQIARLLGASDPDNQALAQAAMEMAIQGLDEITKAMSNIRNSL